jgi:hypothetical protein
MNVEEWYVCPSVSSKTASSVCKRKALRECVVEDGISLPFERMK